VSEECLLEAAPAAGAPAHARLLLPALSFIVMIVAVLQTLVVPVLANIGEQLGASTASVGWVITANLLAAAVMTPLLGRLGDVHGKRPVLLGILVVVVIGSVLAAATSSLALLILGRVLQGASYGLFPLGIAVLRDALPGDRLTSAMAIVSGTLGVGGGFGLVLTGLLTSGHSDYHRIFWLAAAVSVIGLALTWWVVPHTEHAAGGSVDWSGGAVLGASLILLLLPLSQAHVWGWASPATIGCFVGFGVVVAAWVLMERRITMPLVTPTMLTDRPVLVTNLAGLCVGMAMFISFLGVSTFVQTPTALAGYGFTASVLSASVVYLLPGALVGVLASPLAGRLVRRAGGRITLVLALALCAAGFLLLTMLHGSSWQVIVGAILVNTGVSVGYAAMPALLVAEVAAEDTGIANSVNSIARAVGSAIASAVVVTLLTSEVLPGIGVPTQGVYTAIFGIGTGLCVLTAVLVTLGLPRNLRRPTEAEQQAENATALAGEWAAVSGLASSPR
jgi:predicted MFS family arabinose efflux permease